MARTVSILAALMLAVTAIAQEATIELEIDSHVLEVGEAIDAQLVCTNTGRPGTPQAVVPDGLELALRNSQPSYTSRMNMINNQLTQWTEYRYPLRLTAVKPGTYFLGPITVEAEGKEYRAEPVRVVVRQAEETSGARGDQYIFCELTVEPKSLYVTESYTAGLTIGIRKVEVDGRLYDMNLLRDVLDVRGSQLSIFADGRASSSERRLTDSSGRQHAYEIFRVTKSIRAEEVGRIRVGPIFLTANYPTALRRGFGFFSGPQVARARKETARADAILIDVKAPPEEGRPPDFAGAIGSYRMQVTTKPTRVEQGKPVTLTIAISGNPIEGIAGPDLAEHAELASRFDYAKDELVGDIEGGKKAFRRAIFPRQEGEQTVPPISWSYFDPRAERYVTLTSEPTTIVVDPPTGGARTIELADQVPGRNGTTLTVLTGGISPNYVDADLVLADQTLGLTPGWIASLIVPPLAWLSLTLVSWRRARLRGDLGFARRRRARRDACGLLDRAVRESDVHKQWDGLSKALKSYLSNRFNLPPGELTPDEAEAVLLNGRADRTTAREVAEFLRTCNEARFAPGALEDASIGRAARDVRRWIKRIEGTTR